MQLNVPIRLIEMTRVKMSSPWADEYWPSLPIVRWGQPMRRWVRLSAHAYNQAQQYQRLAEALAEMAV